MKLSLDRVRTYLAYQIQDLFEQVLSRREVVRRNPYIHYFRGELDTVIAAHLSANRRLQTMLAEDLAVEVRAEAAKMIRQELNRRRAKRITQTIETDERPAA